MHPRIALAITRKDLVDAIRNMYLVIALVLPIAMSLLFRFLFGSGSDAGAGALDISIHDPGKSQLVQYLIDSKQFSLYFAGSSDEVTDQIRQKDLLGGLVVPAGFDAEIVAGTTPELYVYLNTQRGGLRLMAFRQLVDSGLRDLAGQEMPAKLRFSEMSNVTGGAEATFDLTRFYLMLFLVMSLVMTGVFVVPYILVEEKEKQTLKAILVSPATYADVVVGKALVGLFYALAIALILLLMNDGFTGNVPATLATLFVGSLFLVMVGLLMGAIFKTVSQVNSWSSLVMLALLLPAMMSDFLAPPKPISTLMGLVPTTYMVRGLTQGMNDTATLAGMAINLGVLAAATSTAFIAIIWFLRRERK